MEGNKEYIDEFEHRNEMGFLVYTDILWEDENGKRFTTRKYAEPPTEEDIAEYYAEQRYWRHYSSDEDLLDAVDGEYDAIDPDWI